jgi:hypothetical protein
MNNRIISTIEMVLLIVFLCLPIYACTEYQQQSTKESAITSSIGHHKSEAPERGHRDKWDFANLYIPAIVSLIVLFITNLVTLWKIRLDSKSAIKRELTLQEIKRKKDMLDSFYNPIFYLLKLNGELFESLGPQSFPEEHHAREEAVLVWDKVVENAIIPNNRKICDIINKFCHLMDSQDSLENYFDFVKHAESYEVFRKDPNQIHMKFKYPISFFDAVKKSRSRVMNSLSYIEKDVGKFISERNY